jgi:phospholipase C
MRPTTDVGDVLDGFDYVVVLILENRSFDNLLGYLYPDGVPDNAPAGKTFEGVVGKNLANLIHRHRDRPVQAAFRCDVDPGLPSARPARLSPALS